VLQESLHKLYDRLNEELPRQGHDDVTLDIAPIDQDFKRKHKEVSDKTWRTKFLLIKYMVTNTNHRYLQENFLH
jgi:hypothetical protein